MSGGRNDEVDFRGQPRSNRTHRSSTDPEALLARKSAAAPAKLSYAGHILMENRSALIVDMELTQANGQAEREAATQMLRRLPVRKRRRTLAADKAYDTKDFVASCRNLGVTPHVAQNTTRRASAVDRANHPSCRPRHQPADPQTERGAVRLDQDHRRREKAPLQMRRRNRAWFLMAGAVYNVLRIAALDAALGSAAHVRPARAVRGRPTTGAIDRRSNASGSPDGRPTYLKSFSAACQGITPAEER